MESFSLHDRENSPQEKEIQERIDKLDSEAWEKGVVDIKVPLDDYLFLKRLGEAVEKDGVFDLTITTGPDGHFVTLKKKEQQ